MRHYLKILLDYIFGVENLRNEIIWNRTASKGLQSVRLAANHDVLLAYGRSGEATWNKDEAFVPYDEAELDEKTASKYSLKEQDGRRYQLTSLINPNPGRPSS